MAFILTPSLAVAEQEASKEAPLPRELAAEANVMWPFFPGGISEFKLLIPTTAGGEILVGTHSDFKQKKRFDKGRVNIKALKVGYRQYLWRGLHAEASANIGWRHEHLRPSTGRNHDNMIVSTWLFVGYQLDLGKRFYVNSRGGIGHIAYRSDIWPGQSKGIFGAGDINVGVYF